MQIVPCDEKQIKVTKRFKTADEKTRGFQKEWVVLRCSSGYFCFENRVWYGCETTQLTWYESTLVVRNVW